jgi:hypothetical protein
MTNDIARGPEIIAKAAEALAESVASIINDSSITEREKLETLARSFAQAEVYLQEELPADALAKSVVAAADPAIAFENTDGARMTFPNKRALAMWLAIQRVTKAEKEPNMDPLKNLQDFVKAGRIADIAKVLVADGDGHSITENEFTSLISAHAQREYPTLSPAQAFDKVFSANTAEGKLLRQAHLLTKAWPAPLSIEPVMTGGTDAFPSARRREGSSPSRQDGTNNGGESSAYDQLVAMAERQRRDGETAAQAFARIYAEPANRHLADAERAESRPAYGVRIVD